MTEKTTARTLRRELETLLAEHGWYDDRCECGWENFVDGKYVKDHCEHVADVLLAAAAGWLGGTGRRKAYLAEMTDRRAASPVAVPLPEETEDQR